jgi:ATP-dependent Clp protease ATP-binding subunit ClpC
MGSMYPFERLTERSKKVLTLAQDEAEHSHVSYIGTEHILIGLMRETRGLAAQILARLSIDIGVVREHMAVVLGRGESAHTDQVLPTSRVKKVIEIAFEETRRMGHNYVGTEHLLLALLIEGEGVAAHTLEELGASIHAVRAELERLLRENVEPEELAPRRPSLTPVLDRCGVDLMKQSRDGQLDVLSSREREVTRIVEILSQQSRTSPLVVGDANIRSAVLAGVARRIWLGEVPSALDNRELKRIDPDSVFQNARARGEFRRRLEQSLLEVVEEVQAHAATLLVIDEIDQFLVAGDREWLDVTSRILTPAITSGQIQCIGCASQQAFSDHLLPRSQLLEWFETVQLRPASTEDVIEIIGHRRASLEFFHGVTIDEATVTEAASRSGSHPSRAISFLDRAAAHVRRRAGEPPEEIRELQKEIRKLRVSQDDAVNKQDFEAAAAVRDQVKKLQTKLGVREATWRDAVGASHLVVTPADLLGADDTDAETNRGVPAKE